MKYYAYDRLQKRAIAVSNNAAKLGKLVVQMRRETSGPLVIWRAGIPHQRFAVLRFCNNPETRTDGVPTLF